MKLINRSMQIVKEYVNILYSSVLHFLFRIIIFIIFALQNIIHGTKKHPKIIKLIQRRNFK